jgi:hypothetical protein
MRTPKARAKAEVASAVSPRLLAAMVLALLPLLLLAGSPQWWSDQNVIAPNAQPNDYAAANQGQVKNIVVGAIAELNAHLPGGAGEYLNTTLLPSLTGATANTNDYAAVNLGQLKNLAKPFYDRLLAVGYTAHPLESGTYPWINPALPANDYAMANIGQVKNLFSFDLMSTDAAHDTDQDKLPDWWERYYFGNLSANANDAALRGDGLTNLQAFQQGLNPSDYYNGQTPTITKVSGDNQTGAPNGFVPAPLVVSVADTNGQPFTGAPVTFSVTQGGGTVQKTNLSPAAATLTVNTDSSGKAKAFFKLPNATTNTSQVTATTGSGNHSVQVTFTESSDNGGTSYADPFDPTDIVATLNPDGSVDVSWTNNTDPNDTEPINIRYRDRSGGWVTAITVPAGTTSAHVPAQ